MNKLKLWDKSLSWEAADKAWEETARLACHTQPLKTLPSLPKMAGITPDTARFLKLKAASYLIRYDKNRVIFRYLIRWRYLTRLALSYFRPSSFHRTGDFFFYGIKDFEEFEHLFTQPNHIIVVGFSYCHKPHECPSGRFSTSCQHDSSHPVCQQCFIGKIMHALPDSPRIIPLSITTIHYIGEEMCKIVSAHPGKQVIFLITACEMTLSMFSDFGNMIGIRGIGVRLDGRICNTMQAFHLSEHGIKPGLTVVLPNTQKQILSWVRALRGS
ncbi:MAG: hypothetical protein KGZ39_08555 [Simkania sp.]|nr:hypothetical protein [Simkania sp.]